METRVLIIGAGATGTGIARDLALRGVECLVVDRGDINAGASGANHGLLHSGARYAAVDPESARECRDESRLLKRFAPQAVEDTGGLFVAVPGDDERYIADFPSNCERSGIAVQALEPREALDIEPNLSREAIAAYRVEDASVNPFKLSIDAMAHAETLGARFFARTEVTGMERSGGRITAVRLRRELDGREWTVHPEQVVNATGAWASAVTGLLGISIPLVCSKGTVLISQQRVARQVVNRLRPPADADIVVPGSTVSLIGTTSVRQAHPDRVEATFPEVDFLVAESAKMLPILSEVRYIRAFAGVRSLVAAQEEAGSDRALGRSFHLWDHERDGLSNLVSIFGGKLTTFRLMAEKVADRVCERLGVSAPCATRELPLPAAEVSRWIEPHLERRSWLRCHDARDTLICECEMVPLSVVEELIGTLRAHDMEPDFNAISLRSRVGKGSCQGAFCAFRICGVLYRQGLIRSDEGLKWLRSFLEERWSGLRPVAWGRQLVQEQLQEAIHCALLGLEL